MADAVLEKGRREIAIRHLGAAELERLSANMKLSLSREDMEAVRGHFAGLKREPTDVELEVIAQTWSEHCKHRIFGARIEHRINGRGEVIDGLFKTFVRGVTDEIRKRKPDLVVAAFDDNAGFVRLDDKLAVCLKVETHNHPSAIDPYGGANTGLGGVIRDILGAGKGAKPIASSDVFCFGRPDTDPASIAARDVIHPLGVMRGVVRGVRDYGNRMGIPTVSGAIQFDDAYTYNPLVFCGTAGVIPLADIRKEVAPGMVIVAVGGRTGRDGLHGATFSSASLGTDSHEADQQAVQIGNPIEEKKAADFLLEARRRGLIEFVTDCGAGGFSSAAGEMLSVCGGEIFLENAPLKEPALSSWEIFLSESQERMVLAVNEEALPELRDLAQTYETECVELGRADGSGILKVWHDGALVCELDCGKLHDAPRRHLVSHFDKPVLFEPFFREGDPGRELRQVLADFAIVSREPIIREYDHEVQGNTFLKPLAGAQGDAPQDGAVIHIDGSERLMAMSLSLLPEWGKSDPFAMGVGCVDEAFRQLVACGADPERIALLDNFCVGNPQDPREMGMLVETCKGMATAALAYEAPFVSGKDSFYNYFETDNGPVSIPVTLLVSGLGIVENRERVTGASLRRAGSAIGLLGLTRRDLGASVYARVNGIAGPVPQLDCRMASACYRAFHRVLKSGLILSAHDVSEGGLAVALAEFAFSGVAGLDIDLDKVPTGAEEMGVPERLFGECGGRLIFEFDPDRLTEVRKNFVGLPFGVIGRASTEHGELRVDAGSRMLFEESLSELKQIWKTGLKPYY